MSNYLDNLELTDRTLGEVRRWLEDANLWAQTTMIVSSDHPFRPDAWSNNSTWTKEEADLSENKRFPYVPFIVKIAGESCGLKYERPLSTLISKSLILALLERRLTSADEVAAWLDANGVN